MRNIIIDLEISDTWKIQLIITINFIPSKYAEEERVINSSSSNIKFTPYNDANDVVDELFKSPRSGYQENLETSIKESDFFLIQFN